MFSFLRKTIFGASNVNAEPTSEKSSLVKVPVRVNLPLPEDIIILILSHLHPDDLFNNCIYVEEWEPLVRSQTLWSLKCEREHKAMPRCRPNPIPECFYQHLYFASFGQNLLKNPCGEQALNHWHVVERERGGRMVHYSLHTLEGWEVENPPAGADEVPDSQCQFCFATTHYWCRKGQLIDLWEEGFSSELIQTLKPKIYVGEWYCARFDCGSEYILNVNLLDDKMMALDSYDFYHKETQWTGRAWSHTEHVFVDYPTTIRYIYFIHAGKDTQFWAGHYGSKMAEGQVILRLE